MAARRSQPTFHACARPFGRGAARSRCGKAYDGLAVGRTGFTLVEVLLVLALLVAMAALAWPVIRQPLEIQQLRSGADQIRTRWIEARVEAIRSGQTYLFQYTPETGTYRLDVYSLDSSVVDPATATADQALAAVAPSTASGTTASSASRIAKQYTLPEDVVFAAVESALDERASLTMAQIESSQPNIGGTSEAQQCAPIFFYPDGTSSTAQVLIHNGKGKCLKMSLRGLTGVVTVGKIQSSEGILP